MNERMTDDPDLHWLHWSIRNHIAVGENSNKSCLILGSNEGWMEIAVRQGGFLGRIVASDIADKALTRARAKVDAIGLSGIEHICADLNTFHFEKDAFDFIVAEGVLHHVENIEFCIDGLRSSLKSGGKLIANEFVGAHRFQFPEPQVRWINAALDLIPRKYRPFSEGREPNLPREEEERRKAYYVPMTTEQLIAMDPSEAVSGHLLIDALKRWFVFDYFREGGGALVMNMSGHFPFEDTNTDPDCAAWLRIMAGVEETLYKQGIVPSDVIFFVAT
jgi:SAM-dependent methyltransferase